VVWKLHLNLNINTPQSKYDGAHMVYYTHRLEVYTWMHGWRNG